MKIYTRQGDDGTTGLYRQSRVQKSHPLIEAIGAVDELNSVLGVVMSMRLDPPHYDRLGQVQHHLFDLGAELASRSPEMRPHSGTSAGDESEASEDEPGEQPTKISELKLTSGEIEMLEAWIDEMEEHLPELRQFILPGGTTAAAYAHLARTVCRRAERQVDSLSQMLATKEVGSCATSYLNRLSDYLFVLARSINADNGTEDVFWAPGSRG